MSYLNSAILPSLGHLRVGAAVRADVARFFHEYGRRKPGGANRSHEILRNMFDCAIAWGHRPEAAGNPCTGIVRYRRPPRGRLLGANDLAKLGATLRRLESERPDCVAAVRLILLTGCRPGEIRCLRWCEVKPDRLALIDAKTGPRHVLLGEAARKLLDSLADTASGEWVFPGKGGDDPMSNHVLYWFWIKTRDAAGIVADARLHDLRHAHASHAVMNGESLHIAGRLLGQRAIVLLLLDSPDPRCVSRHCGAAHVRSSKRLAPACERSRKRQALERAGVRSLRAPQTIDNGQTVTWTTVNNVTVAYRLLPGTIEPPRPVIPQHRSPRPQSNNLQRSTPKTADNSPVALSGVGLANATCSARIDLSAAFESSSQPPLSSCCDDRLNPPYIRGHPVSPGCRLFVARGVGGRT